jgi:DNA-binding protein H-NS
LLRHLQVPVGNNAGANGSRRLSDAWKVALDPELIVSPQGAQPKMAAINLTAPLRFRLDQTKEAATCGHNNFKKLDRNLPRKGEKDFAEGRENMISDLNLMSADELWSLRVELDSALEAKIREEKAQLDQRLRLLRAPVAVSAKFCNPARPSETWSGRGRQPRWLSAQLRSGKNLDDFRIQPS